MFFVSSIMIIVGYVNQLKKCPPPKIVYRYIPRTFKQEQDNPVQASKIFSTMFEEPTPWVAGTVLSSGPKKTAINRYFISQSD
jgi:hypothetical protein